MKKKMGRASENEKRKWRRASENENERRRKPYVAEMHDAKRTQGSTDTCAYTHLFATHTCTQTAGLKALKFISLR
jgi:hypothetical protein